MSNLTDKELAHILQEELTKLMQTGKLDARDLATTLVKEFNITYKVEPGDADELHIPIKGQTLRWGDLAHNSESQSVKGTERVVTDIAHANTVSSDRVVSTKPGLLRRPIHGYGPEHNMVFDIDYPVTVIESSPGRSHLYIDAPMSWTTLVMLMSAFVEAGLMEPGYMFASIERGYTSVRVPWALKNSGHQVEAPPEPDARIVNPFNDLDF